MKLSNISEMLKYIMIAVLIIFFILVCGKIINRNLENREYFTEKSYTGVITENSLKNDEIQIDPKMDLSGNMVKPLTFKIMSDNDKESDMFNIDNSGTVTLKLDASGNVKVGDSFNSKIVVTDSSSNKLEAELVIDVSDVISTFVNPVENNEKVDANTYKEMNNVLNTLLNNINNGMSQLSLANSNNKSEEEVEDNDEDVIEGFTNHRGGYYYVN
jgi:hypothetical protein